MAVTPPRGRWGGLTGATPSVADTSRLVLLTAAGPLPCTARTIGVSWNGGNWDLITSSTWRPLALFGRTWASTDVNLMPRNGIPSRIRNNALIVAIGIGLRMTRRESRYQNPSRVARAARSARRAENRGRSEVTP